jgi:membrane associated rhomboid family serine protease
MAGGTPRGTGDLVTKIIIGLNLVVFLAVLAVGDRLVDDLMLVGRRFVGGEFVGVAEGQWYRLITAAFTHQQPMHLLFNMVFLWFLGRELEMLLGRGRYIVLYVVSALGGTAASYWLAPAADGSIGASGALYGLLGALIVLERRRSANLRPLLILLAVNLVITFALPANIDWRAHLGGLVAGTLTGIGMLYAPRAHRALVQTLSVTAVLAVIVVVDLLRTAQLA